MDIYQIIFSNSSEMSRIKAIIDEIAKTDIMVLIRGEVGTEKELLARAVHLNSHRKDKPFVVIDCPLIPARYFPDEPFGLEKRDPTGDYFQMLRNGHSADNGTILLKDLDESNISIQAKLLQLFRDDASSHFSIPTEGDRIQSIAPRVVASSRDHLGNPGKEGYFSSDPFSKIHFVSIAVPPLRERKEQIPPLTQYYFNFYKEQYGKDVSPFSSKVMEAFGKYDWPGNIDELENMVKRIVITGNEDAIQQNISLGKRYEEMGLGFHKNSSNNFLKDKNSFKLRDVRKKGAEVAELEIIRGILEETRWNRKRAAKLLGISYHALLYKIQKYNLM